VFLEIIMNFLGVIKNGEKLFKRELKFRKIISNYPVGSFMIRRSRLKWPGGVIHDEAVLSQMTRRGHLGLGSHVSNDPVGSVTMSGFLSQMTRRGHSWWGGHVSNDPVGSFVMREVMSPMTWRGH